MLTQYFKNSLKKKKRLMKKYFKKGILKKFFIKFKINEKIF